MHEHCFHFLGMPREIEKNCIIHFHICHNSTGKWCRKHAGLFELVLKLKQKIWQRYRGQYPE